MAIATKRVYSTGAYIEYLYHQLAPQLYRLPRSPEAWAKQKQILKKRLWRLLGDWPKERVPLNPEILEERSYPGYRRLKVVIDTEPMASMPAYLYLPETHEKRPGILALHGHGRGKADVAGEAQEDQEKWVKGLNYDYARQLAEQGYVVFAPDARCFGERGQDGWSCARAVKAAFLLGRTLVGMRVWDAFRALDYLESLPQVDPNRLACVGLSWGGTHTLYTSALDDRVKVAVISGYFSSFKDVLLDRDCCPCQYVPGILKVMDLPQIAALIAPRPLLIEDGLQDPLYTPEVVRQEFQRLKHYYTLSGAPDKVELDQFEGGHIFHGVRAFPFLKENLFAPEE